MKELKCPKCGNVFKVDEADYAFIVSQVKTAEFEAEINHRLSELRERHKAEQELATAKTEQTFQSQLSKKELELGAKDAEIERLKSQLAQIEAQKESELATALAAKDQEIATLRAELEEFKKAPGASTSQVVETEKKDNPQDKHSAVEDFFATRQRATELYNLVP